MVVYDSFLKALDKLTGFFTMITGDHRYIHEGKAFTSIISATGVSSAYRIAFKTPAVTANKMIHWRPSFLSTSANYCAFVMTEGDTYTSGTANVPINRNRFLVSSGDQKWNSRMQAVAYGVTSTPAGTVVESAGYGTAGIPTSTAGGSGGEVNELVLKPDTVYVITITPAGATDIVLKMLW